MSETNSYGLQNWGDVDLSHPAPQQGKKESKFLKMDEGDNKVRLLTKPSQYWQHKYKPPGDNGYGYRVLCSKAGNNASGTCPLCDIVAKEAREKVPQDRKSVTKAQKRWLVGVIDRKSASYKILDISKTVFQAVQDLYNDEDWGDPIQYDINIKVNRKGGPTGYYGVTPKNAKPLSEADLELKDNEMDQDDLIKRCQPLTPEQVTERMERLAAFVQKRNGGNEDSKASESTNAAPAPATESAPKATSETSENDFDDFPAVDGSASA